MTTLDLDALILQNLECLSSSSTSRANSTPSSKDNSKSTSPSQPAPSSSNITNNTAAAAATGNNNEELTIFELEMLRPRSPEEIRMSEYFAQSAAEQKLNRNTKEKEIEGESPLFE